MQTKGTVISLQADVAIVRCTRDAACDGCHKKQQGECSVCSLMVSNRTLDTVAKNKVGARVGDEVVISSSSFRMTGYAALIFLLPILFMLGGYFVCALLQATKTICYLGAFLGICISFLAIRAYSEYGLRRRTDATVIAILENKTENPLTNGNH